MEPSLYLVGTPIGNLSDMSPRAVDTLKKVDFIAAEDTRNTGILLKKFDIETPMISYHEHNEREKSEEIVRRLSEGQTCAVVTDAGMPAISDPGMTVVRLCHEKGIRVASVPGPCAFVTALAMSGFNSRRFCFEGFLNAVCAKRKKELETLKDEERTLIFYEAPHKLKQTLLAMKEILGKSRRVCIVRELTKIYEEALIFTLEQAVEYFEKTEPRGEFVIVVEGGEKQAIAATNEDTEIFFKGLLAQGKTKSAAAKETAARFGLKKGDIYDRFKD